MAFSTGVKPKNKLQRQAAFVKLKKSRESTKRDARLRRKREENKDPRLRVERRARNVPLTLERKRVWDDVDGAEEEGDGIGLSVDVANIKRRKVDAESQPQSAGALTESNLRQVDTETAPRTGQEDDDDGSAGSFFKDDQAEDDSDEEADDLASLLEDSDAASSSSAGSHNKDPVPPRAPSPSVSATSTNISLIPDALAAKFPTLFSAASSPPKILVTTTLNGTIHSHAHTLTSLFPRSTYIPRSRHKHNSHKFSLRSIAQFAHNRAYTAMVVLEEDHKRPAGLTIIHLPAGPTFHFSITNWVEGRKLPGHGKATEHYPELILNNFRTPLGLLTASLFRTLFPPAPEVQGRQVVTLHNQRDYIFVRRHRYVFRERRPTERAVGGMGDSAGADPKPNDLEDIKTGLQELGPRFTLKLRRIDRGIQRASGQEWEWKSRMEKMRTKFQL